MTIAMKVSERFALNQWLAEYPDDMTYQQILALIKEGKVDKIMPEKHTAGMSWGQFATVIESTRNVFEDTVDDLSPLCLSEVREPDRHTYIITRRVVETYEVQATSQDDAIEEYLNGNRTLIEDQTMELTADAKE